MQFYRKYIQNKTSMNQIKQNITNNDNCFN